MEGGTNEERERQKTNKEKRYHRRRRKFDSEIGYGERRSNILERRRREDNAVGVGGSCIVAALEG